MNRLQLENYASELEMDVYHISYHLLRAKQLMLLQSICVFNVWWMADISPLLMSDETVKFLTDNKDHFKRKMTAREFVLYDAIIKHKCPETFKEFTLYVKTQTLTKNP